MLSRQDVRPQQTQTLLKTGFLPISIDYRLCPETTLVDGPMRDVCSAHEWARCILPSLQLKRTDIRPDGDRVVAIGWSTGGHLAMTLAWTAPAAGIAAPNASRLLLPNRLRRRILDSSQRTSRIGEENRRSFP